jgi:hypothetical protein
VEGPRRRLDDQRGRGLEVTGKGRMPADAPRIIGVIHQTPHSEWRGQSAALSLEHVAHPLLTAQRRAALRLSIGFTHGEPRAIDVIRVDEDAVLRFDDANPRVGALDGDNTTRGVADGEVSCQVICAPARVLRGSIASCSPSAK